MSLNGLDDPAVIDAYQSALTEAGGWLLLKYASRDEVTLYNRGTGGVSDVRAAVEAYDEKSPLYGFLQYRRRKVVLKYLPDGVSRLILARTTVQFQSILDKFSPHDTTFEFKNATDLTESALSSACLLHAASGSMTSSSSSLRRRRLMEIAEDAEEGVPTAKTDQELSQSEARTRRLSQTSDATAVPPPTPGDNGPADSPIVADDEADARTETASMRSVSRNKLADNFAQQPYEHRGSIQSMRPSLQDLGYSTPRQKVKLGPRPSVDMNGRPRTAGSMSRSQDQRPVAALPAGVRARKPPSRPGRPKSQPDAVPVPTLASLKNAPPMPLLIPPPSISIPRPKLSPGAKSMNALPSSGMSPEKQRLMKALELRKKQMEKKTKELQKKEEIRETTPAAVTTRELPAAVSDNKNYDPVQTTKQPLSEGPHLYNMDTSRVDLYKEEPATVAPVLEEKKPTTADLAKADSAVEMATAAREDNESKSTLLESTVLEDAALEVARPEDTEPQVTMIKDAVSEDTVSRATSVKDAVSEETTSKGGESLVRPAEAPITTEPRPLEGKADVMESHPEPNPDLAGQSNNEDTTDDSVAPELFSDRTDDEKATTASTPEPETAPEDVAKAHDERSSQEEDDDSTPTASEAIHSITASSAGSQDGLVAGAPEAAETASKEVPTISTSTSTNTALAGSTAAPLSLSQADENNRSHLSSQEKNRRIALLDPIQVPTPDLSDEDNLLSDDSFMEELKSATLQEAQPVSVGKGPLSPDSEAWQTRAVSNPSRRPSDISAVPGVGRSISATYAGGDEIAGPISMVTAKKVNVSSGISKRIKALEMFSSNRDSAPSPATLAVPSANGLPSPSATAFEKFRKRASVSMNGSLPPSTTSSARSSFIGPSPDVASQPSLSRKDPHSVSVTARIVRDSSTPPANANSDPVESGVLNLQRSPLIVEHNAAEDADQKSNSVPEQRPTLPARGLSRSSTDTAPARSGSRASSRSRRDDMSPEEKRDSHKLPPPPTEENTQHATGAAAKTVDIGEVNVQFPDTLLWKRRFLRIDNQGYLVLTPGSTDTGTRNIVKRYHLSEFETPCLPDEDRQELPNSILLDFRNGSTLQCACESRKDQAAALQTLVDAHNAYRQ